MGAGQLYIVGNDAGGWHWDTYNLELSGFAINSGCIAGESAAKYVSGNK
jgi:hypothetical protein